MNIRVTVGSDNTYIVNWPNTFAGRILRKYVKVRVRHVSALGECAYIDMKELGGYVK